jgi:hypothetical protein
MTPYQVLLLILLVAWPLTIAGLLVVMQRLDRYVARLDAKTPEDAGLEPVEGETGDREVKIVVDEPVAATPEPVAPKAEPVEKEPVD